MNTFDQEHDQAAGGLSPEIQAPSDAWSGPADPGIRRTIVELHRTDVRWNLVAIHPGVPWYHLPRVHRLLEEDYRKAGAIIYRSYLRFLWDALRLGVHGTASGSGFLTTPEK